MSKKAEAVKERMDQYLNCMRLAGKEPPIIHLTKADFKILRDNSGKGKDFRPRYRGIEVKSV